MALTNVALVGTQGPFSPIKAVGIARIKMDLDADYTTGGYTTFSTTIKTALSNTGITVLAVLAMSPFGGYKPIYNRATDALLIYQGAAGLGPDAEVPLHTNLGAVTAAEVVVIYE